MFKLVETHRNAQKREDPETSLFMVVLTEEFPPTYLRVSFALADIEEDDHDHPIAERMLLAVSGVVHCAGDGGKPTNMHCYVRPLRYYSVGTQTNLVDFLDAEQIHGGGADRDAMFVLSDNGPGYGVESPVVLHMFGRVFRNHGLAWLALGLLSNVKQNVLHERKCVCVPSIPSAFTSFQ